MGYEIVAENPFEQKAASKTYIQHKHTVYTCENVQGNS